MPINPLGDAIEIGNFLLDSEAEAVNFGEIEIAFDWERRRRFLALLFLKENLFYDWNWEYCNDPSTPVGYFMLLGKYRARLQDFVNLQAW
jgi:hypothetical protein